MTITRPLACLAVLTLAACGTDPAPDPVEQIIVREPGAAPAAAAAAGEPAGTLVAEGRAAFASCSACHSAEQGAASGVGPNLAGVVGRPAGQVAGFAYSDAMKQAGTDGHVWTEEELDKFLTKPRDVIAGTKMTFAGIRNEQERADLIAYLATFPQQ